MIKFLSTYDFPCCYSFKRCKIYNSFSAGYFLTFNAVDYKDETSRLNLKGVAEKKPLEGQPLKRY